MKQLILFIVTVFAFVLSSCQDEPVDNLVDDEIKITSEGNVNTDMPGVTCINGVLHFENAKVVFDVVKKLSQMSYETFKDWEKENNFKSLKTIINEAYEEMKNPEGVYIYNNKYSRYLYLDEDSCMTAYVNAEMYQLICNADAEFYVQEVKHKVDGSTIVMTDMEKGEKSVVPYINVDGLSRGAGSGYTVAKKIYNKGKKSVVAYLGTYIFSVKDNTGKETYQMMLEFRSKARKRYLGGWHEAQALHGLEGASFIAKDIAFLENGKVVRKWAKGKARSLYAATHQVNAKSVVPLGDPVYERLSNDKTAIVQATLRAETNELPRFRGAVILHGYATHDYPANPWLLVEGEQVCDPRTKTGNTFLWWNRAADSFDHFSVSSNPLLPEYPVDLSNRMEAV